MKFRRMLCTSAALLLALISINPAPMLHAQWLSTPQPGDIFKEFGYRISHSGNSWRVTDPNTPRADAQAYLPNAVHSFSINDLQGAIRAEVMAEVWGGHVGTINKRFRFNNNAWITFPEMGAANGIPAGTSGECYTQQLNYTVPIPLSHLVQGTNSFTGTSGGQTCFNFNWGQWGWYQIMVRVYYGPSKPHTTGSITSPSNGGTIGENPTVTASVNGSASQVDFLAYYYGYDTDGDGIWTQYHHSYNRTKNETTVIMKNHVGSRTSSPWQVTWNTNLVPDQAAGSVRLIARIRDNNGTWYMTNAITNLTLQRTGSVKMYRMNSIPQRFWVRTGRTPQTVSFTIPSGDNLANATSAHMLIRTWNANDDADANLINIRVNNHTFPLFGEDHFYSYDAVSFPKSALVNGTNNIRVDDNTTHHGIEVLWPGPAVIVRYSTGGGGGSTPPAITQHPSNQSVSVGQTATFSVQATGTAPLSYQWQKNNVNITGATNSSYTTPATVVGDNGATYRCVVTNSIGSATSNPATLTVGSQAPSITQHPTNKTVSVGQTTSFTVAATGTAPLSYQWQKNNSNINGATNASYTIPAATLGDNGSTYRCIVTNDFGSATSNPATLTVTEPPPPGSNLLTNPGFESGTAGWTFFTNGSGSFTSEPPGYEGNRAAKIAINTVGSNMQLYQTNLPLTAGTDYTLSFAARSSSGKDVGVAVIKHTTPNTNYGLNNVNVDLTTEWQVFTLQFTAGGFAGTVTDARLRFFFNGKATTGETYYIDNVILQVTGSGPTAPVITSHPANQTVGVGETATFVVEATGTGLGYQWQKNNTNITGATSASYTTPPTVIADNGSTYRCVVSNAGGSATSNAATLTVMEHTVQNLVQNPGFESGTANWTWFTNGTGGFASVIPGFSGLRAGQITVTTAGSNMQLYQIGIPVESGANYRLSFRAMSSTGRDLAVALIKHTTPNTNYGLRNTTVDVTTSWQQFVINFTAGGFAGTVNDGRLRFFFNGLAVSGEVYHIDDVVLERLTRSAAPETMAGEIPAGSVPSSVALMDNYPNPFNPETRIKFALPEPSRVTVSVFDMLGQEVATLSEGIFEPGIHMTSWNGRTTTGNLAGSGVYLYRMVAVGESGNTVVQQKKMVLMK